MIFPSYRGIKKYLHAVSSTLYTDFIPRKFFKLLADEIA